MKTFRHWLGIYPAESGIGQRRRDVRGMAALEFAIIAPVVIIATLGVIETVKVVRAKALLTAAVANMVEMVAIESGAPPLTRLNLQDYCRAAQLTMRPFVTAGLAISVASVTNKKTPLPAGPARDWEYGASCPTTAPALGAAGATSLAASMVPNVGDSVIVAIGSYRYVPTAVISPFTFTQTVFARPRYSSVPCADC